MSPTRIKVKPINNFLRLDYRGFRNKIDNAGENFYAQGNKEKVLFRMDEEKILEYLLSNIKNGGNVLDVGCGTGSIMKKIMEKKNVKIVGIDPYPEYNECIKLTAEEVEQLGLTFDVIYAVYSLHHIDRMDSFLNAVKNILSPKGKLIIIDWKEGADTGVDEKYYSVEEVEELLENYTFVIEESKMIKDTFIIKAGIK